MHPSADQPSGILLVDKPSGITSFDIIRQLRRQTGLKKFGHAGTLDPMATGLMIILVGSATKQAQVFSGMDKTYSATIKLGSTSSTGDAEGILTAVSPRTPTLKELEDGMSQLTGQITQQPSRYSAIKIDGVEAYKRARKGEQFEMPTRQVNVYSFVLESYRYPDIACSACVSSGTYIRSLAEDLGVKLSTGAYLSALTRTQVGPYSLKSAIRLEDITGQSLQTYLMRSEHP